MNLDRYSLIDNISSQGTHESGYGTSEGTSRVEEPPHKFRQYFAAFSATFSALAAGTVLGWTSPILDDLENGKFQGISLDSNQIGWIGSFVTLGGMVMCIPTGFICDLIGRKKTLLSLFVPYTLGWILIIFSKNVTMLYFGRLITGMAAGACCIAAPLYTSEIAHKSLRGTLGSYFQLMVTVGIFLAYILGKYFNPIHFTIWCACMPVIFVVLFSWQPESPTYLLKGRHDVQAKQALIKLRGKHYNIVAELLEIEGSIKESTQSTVSLKETFRQKHVIKSFVISVTLMFLQQVSGINAIILYTTEIFKSAGVKLDPKDASILVGAVQVAATFVSSLVVDKLGRRILLLISSAFISISTLLLAIYFTIKYRTNINPDVIQELGFLPVGALCLFMVVYSLGLGPIPWIISSEIFPTEIKSISSSTAGTVNWFLAFILTKFYLQIIGIIGQDSTFYIFSVFSGIGLLFIYFAVPETKGKTMMEIQLELRNELFPIPNPIV